MFRSMTCRLVINTLLPSVLRVARPVRDPGSSVFRNVLVIARVVGIPRPFRSEPTPFPDRSRGQDLILG